MAATAARLSRTRTPQWIFNVVDTLSGADAGAPEDVSFDGGHSNEIWQLKFSDGRVLLLKRGRHDWAGDCFATAARAARLIAATSDLVVPQPLPVSATADGLPVQAYWRVELPTLEQLWPSLSQGARASALRSMGRMTRRLHEIEAPAWGPLHRADAPHELAGALDRDLRQRLLPAVIAHWPAGIPALEKLIARIPQVQRAYETAAASLVHMDLHLDNVLCRVSGSEVECVGLLDLDGAAGGTAESDLAGLLMLHGPLFERELDSALLQEVLHGYGRPVDDRLLDYFGCAHLANQGFSSALLGHHEHAARIAAELDVQIALLDGTARYWQ